jgi:hypothetical protein
MFKLFAPILILLLSYPMSALTLERPDTKFKIFQFPADMVPRIDADTSDWDMVPESYVIGENELIDTVNNNPSDKNNFDVTVKVGWVNGLNRLYFLYEAYDDYWDFKDPGLEGDVFEVVVDADLSGGPLIPQLRDDFDKTYDWEDYMFHGVHAQNYHIYTPAEGKKWAMVWGCQPWVAELPYANAAYSYDFRHGENGRLILEFWITPFDYAPYEGPGRAIISTLIEDTIIGLSWTILERDEFKNTKTGFAFRSLSHKTTMYGNASDLVKFRLMPIEPQFRKPIEAQWDFSVVDMEQKLVSFKDLSYGDITSWHWDFGDGETSTEQNPIHRYSAPAAANPGGNYQYQYVVVLTVEGPEGSARMSKVWDVAVE